METGTKIGNCKFIFKCPKQWDELEETKNPGVRFCNACDRGVYLAEDEETVALLASLDKCVAYRPEHVSIDDPDDDCFVGMVVSPKPDDWIIDLFDPE